MKSPALLIIALFLILSSVSCGSGSAEQQSGAEHEEIAGDTLPEDTLATGETTTEEQEEETEEESDHGETHEHARETEEEETSSSAVKISGTFHSLKGVMKPLSCYCFNCGTITTAEGEKVDICFEDDEISVSCKEISVSGEFVTKNIDADGACPAGQRTFLRVDDFTCN